MLAAAKTDEAKAEDLKQKAAAKATEVGTQLDAAKADAKSELRRCRGGADCRQGGQGGRGDGAGGEPGANQKAAAKAAELGTQLDAAKADPESKRDAAAAAQNAAKAAEAKRTDAGGRSEREAKLSARASTRLPSAALRDSSMAAGRSVELLRG